MQSCDTCHYCKPSYDSTMKTYRCDISPGKTFNVPKLHGMLCKGYNEENKNKEDNK